MITFNSEYFDAAATVACGQLFRYHAEGEGYRIYAGKNTALVATAGAVTTVEGDDDFFRIYFDLDTDYKEIAARCAAFPEVGEVAVRGRGIRILRQDLFETLISFILSANNNIPRIQGIIERLCAQYGDDMGGYHAFPRPEQLKDVRAERYRALGAGFRDAYVAETVRAVLEGGLEGIEAADTAEAGRRLCAFKGVGRKVADCILLFGLGRTDVYPVDTWIFKAHRTAALDTPEKVRAYCLERYGAWSGYVQQYIYYDKRG